jgi:hypothetical protein
MRRPALSLVLAAALVVGGCQNPDGSTDWGSTLLLGAGVGVAAALAAGAASGGASRHGHAGGYRGRPHGGGYGHGPAYRSARYDRGRW